jgi:hypothetical protein
MKLRSRRLRTSAAASVVGIPKAHRAGTLGWPPAPLEAHDVAGGRSPFGRVRAGSPPLRRLDEGSANALGLVRQWQRA